MGPYGSFDAGISWGGWVAIGAAMVVFWGLVAWGIVLVVRAVGHHHELAVGPPGSSATVHLLEGRFARGEIDADEYSRRRHRLSSS